MGKTDRGPRLVYCSKRTCPIKYGKKWTQQTWGSISLKQETCWTTSNSGKWPMKDWKLWVFPALETTRWGAHQSFPMMSSNFDRNFQSFPILFAPALTNGKDGVSWWTDHTKWLQQDVWDRLSRQPPCEVRDVFSPVIRVMSTGQDPVFFFQSHELTWSKNNDPVELGIIQWLWKAWSMSLEWIINKWFPWNSRGSRIRKVWPTNCRFGSRRLTAFGVGVNRSQGNRLGTNWRIWGFP